MKKVADARPFLSVVAGLVLVMGLSSPLPAQAQFTDPAQATKEYILDPLAWIMKETIKQSITGSIVNWINSGFEGSPAFVTDIERNLGRLGDAVARDFFDELEDRTGVDLNSPFQEQVTDFLRTSYYRNTGESGFFNREGYTLHRIAERDDAFLRGDFSEGGWDAWFSVVTNSSNNPIGAILNTSDELATRVETFRVNRLRELSFGNGFLSWRGDCIEESGGTAEEQALADEEGCLRYDMRTPGIAIQSRLEQALNMSTGSLDIADEISEIVAALMLQLTKQVLGGSGLSGISQSSQGGGSSYSDRLISGTSTAAGLVANFSRSVDEQTESVTRFQMQWTSIKTAAQSAAAACSAEEGQEARAVVTQADAALAKASAALTELGSIRAGIDGLAAYTGTDLVNAVNELSNRFTRLLNSRTYPSAADISEAAAETSAGPNSLLSRMNALAQSCR